MKYKLKKKYVKCLIIFVIIIILIVALVLLLTHKSDDGLKYNKNKKACPFKLNNLTLPLFIVNLILLLTRTLLT